MEIFIGNSFYFETTDSDLILHNKYGVYSKSELDSQLREGHLTVGELGLIYDLGVPQITHVLNSLSIIYRNFLEDTRVPDFCVTPSMHQVLLGNLMGDGYMKNTKSFELGHSIHQIDYFYHTAEQLGPLVSTVSFKKAPLGESLVFWTHRHSSFAPYFKKFYSRGKVKKFFNKDTIRDLSPRGLAFWFMDDGKYCKYGYYLCVGNISKDEGNILTDFLQNKFSLSTTLQVHDLKKNYYNIYIKAESRDRFKDLIQPHIVPSMNYKLSSGEPPRGCKDLIAARHLKYCQAVARPVRFSGDKEIEEEIKTKMVIQSSKENYIEGIKLKIGDGAIVSHTSVRNVPSDTEIRSLFESGLTDGQVAQQLGFGRNRIASIRRSLAIPRKVCR